MMRKRGRGPKREGARRFKEGHSRDQLKNKFLPILRGIIPITHLRGNNLARGKKMSVTMIERTHSLGYGFSKTQETYNEDSTKRGWGSQ